MSSEKKAAWDAVHAAYAHNGTPIVTGVAKKKFVFKKKSPAVAPLRPMSFRGGAEKEEIPEREEEAPKEVEAKKEPPKDDMESKVSAFKAKYGSTLPTTKKKAIVIKKDELEAALRVAGLTPQKAKSAAASYRYAGADGFIIHKTPNNIIIREEKSDFDKEMDRAERQMGEDIRAGFANLR